MYFSELQKHLARDRLRPVYVAYGNNPFEVGQAVAALKARAGRDGDAALSVIELPRDQRDLTAVMDALRSVPMFVDYTMVVLQGAGEFVARHRKALESYLDSPSPSGVLVVTVERWNRTTRLAKRVAELRGDVACWLPRSADEVLGWVQRRARTEHGKRLDAAAARLLADLCQDDPAALAAELAKLELYVGQAEAIRQEDVAAVAMSYADYKPFDLCDHLAAGDLAGAMAVVAALMDQGLPVALLVGTLRSHFRRLLEARLLSDREGTRAAVARFGGPPRQREAFGRQVQRWSADRLTAAYRHLLEADLAAKTSRLPDRLIAERLLLALAARSEATAVA
jgi:DNA polymerase III delta subunit